jgi:hypothetical protein
MKREGQDIMHMELLSSNRIDVLRERAADGDRYADSIIRLFTHVEQRLLADEIAPRCQLCTTLFSSRMLPALYTILLPHRDEPESALVGNVCLTCCSTQQAAGTLQRALWASYQERLGLSITALPPLAKPGRA